MSEDTDTGLGFVKLLYPPRIFGMALAFPAVAVVLYQQQAHWAIWLLAIVNGFIWPHLAYLIASRSANPGNVEYRNLVGDSMVAGMWVPLLGFNLLPALSLLTMTSLANMTVGGLRLFAKGLSAAIVSMLVTWMAVVWVSADFTVQMGPTMLTLIATAPLLVVFPLSVGLISFGMSRDLAQQRKELQRVSQTDGLSGLNNRQYWEASVYTEYERHRRSTSPLSMIMIDIDNFKDVNDEYGHVAGDQVIRDLAELLAESVREADILGRYGGEEFAMLLPDTDMKGALQFAERLRLSVQTLMVKPYGIRCTISLGVAQAKGEVKTCQQLIENADRALYQAKRSGRNIVMEYDAG